MAVIIHHTSGTVMTQLADFVESKVLVAVTVMVVSSRSSARVTIPDCETVALFLSAVATVHVTVSGAKLEVATVHASASVPSDIVAVEGVTVTEETAGAPGTNTPAFAKGDIAKVFHVCNQ